MWISVKDKLPPLNVLERSEKILVFDKGINSICVAILENTEREGLVWFVPLPFCPVLKNVTHWQPLPPLPQDEQQIETEIDIKQGISEQSKKWEDGCNAYNQERINKLAEEIKAKQEELRGCDEISNIVSSGYKAL